MNPQNGWANAINGMVSCISFSDKLVALVPNLYNYCMWLVSAADGLTPKLFCELTMRVCRWPKAHCCHVCHRCGAVRWIQDRKPIVSLLVARCKCLCIENTNVVYNLTLCDDIIIVSLWCSLFVHTRHLNNVNNTASLTLIHLHQITMNFEFFSLFCAEIYCKLINRQQSHVEGQIAQQIWWENKIKAEK